MHRTVGLYSFCGALSPIGGWRVVRLICARWGAPAEVSDELLAETVLRHGDTEGWLLKAGPGCRECRGLGYRGRKAIAELLVLNDEIRELIVPRAPTRQIKDEARRKVTRPPRDAGGA